MSQSQDLLDNVRPYLQIAMKQINTLPLFTLGVTAAMFLFWFLSFVSSIATAFALKPSDLGNFELSRLTTYPLVHSSSMQFIISIAAFVPLCSRFERQYGTLRSLAMFLGPFESVPGLIYCFLDGFVLRQDGIISGCSVFVFVLLSIEAARYTSGSGSNRNVVVAGKEIPVVAAPFLILILTTIFLPGGSFICHGAAIGVGSLFASGRVDFLLLPLKIVNFVEVKADRLIVLVPHYITAEAASTSFTPLPVSEPGGFRATFNQSSNTLSPDTSTNANANLPRAASPNPLLRAESTRPSANRQASSVWPASQRED